MVASAAMFDAGRTRGALHNLRSSRFDGLSRGIVSRRWTFAGNTSAAWLGADGPSTQLSTVRQTLCRAFTTMLDCWNQAGQRSIRRRFNLFKWIAQMNSYAASLYNARIAKRLKWKDYAGAEILRRRSAELSAFAAVTTRIKSTTGGSGIRNPRLQLASRKLAELETSGGVCSLHSLTC
jgi:hypothetical protein